MQNLSQQTRNTPDVDMSDPKSLMQAANAANAAGDVATAVRYVQMARQLQADAAAKAAGIEQKREEYRQKRVDRVKATVAGPGFGLADMVKGEKARQDSGRAC